jgi:4-hydroxybenzoate polyprenyltransferase
MSVRDFLVISRANIQVASLPTALVGCALAADKLADLWDAGVIVFVLLFFTVLTFACNLNCLADVEVDARHKKKMSAAVRSMGEGRIKRLLVAEAALAVVLSAGLAVYEGNALFILGALTLGVAFVYSAPPVRLKGRGWLSPLPVALGLYALPPLGGWYLVRGRLGATIMVFALGYAMLMEGITIVNTCEDHPEDELAGIRTLAHVLGLRRTLNLGAWLAGMGGALALVVTVLRMPGESGGLAPFRWAAAGALATFFAWTVAAIVGVLRKAARTHDPASESKAKARLMPVWFLKTRYPLLFIALLLK